MNEEKNKYIYIYIFFFFLNKHTKPQCRKWGHWSQRTWENMKEDEAEFHQNTAKDPFPRTPQSYVGQVGRLKTGQLTASVSKDVPFEDQTFSPERPSLDIPRTFTDFLFGKFLQNPLRSQHCYYLNLPSTHLTISKSDPPRMVNSYPHDRYWKLCVYCRLWRNSNTV